MRDHRHSRWRKPTQRMERDLPVSEKNTKNYNHYPSFSFLYNETLINYMFLISCSWPTSNLSQKVLRFIRKADVERVLGNLLLLSIEVLSKFSLLLLLPPQIPLMLMSGRGRIRCNEWKWRYLNIKGTITSCNLQQCYIVSLLPTPFAWAILFL